MTNSHTVAFAKGEWDLKSCFKLACLLFGIYICASAVAHYSNYQPEPIVRLCLFGVGAFCLKYLSGKPSPSKREIFSWIVFSFALALSLMLGFHIRITGPTYDGLATENYIAPYEISDILALICMTVYLSIMFIAIFAVAKTRHEKQKSTKLYLARISRKKVLIGAIALFLMFLPYFLIYYPGLIFGDSMSSLRQIASGSYNNHFPFFYTMYIRVCIKAATMFGFSITTGIAIYTFTQMALMALCLSYLTNWIATRCSISPVCTCILLFVFGLTPYVATYSIAMWKDPLFSCAVVIATLMIADYTLSAGHTAETKLWNLRFAIVLSLIGLLRSNGIAIIGFLVIILIIAFIFRKKSSVQFAYLKRVSIAVMSSFFACLIITGPIYGLLGVEKAPRVESVGIPLSQMARVVALGKVTSESDLAYMDSLLPLEEYPDIYTPTCIDTLKWAPHFNGSAIEYGPLLKHWSSMLIDNPGTFFESWELQTFGYWAINVPAVNTYDYNINGAVPRNTSDEYAYQLDELGVNDANVLGAEWLRTVFPLDEWAIPLSLVNWFIVWILLCALLLRRGTYCISLAPSIGLIASLLIASPIWYWPRYGAAEHFLIPFYICLLFMFILGASPELHHAEIATRIPPD